VLLAVIGSLFSRSASEWVLTQQNKFEASTIPGVGDTTESVSARAGEEIFDQDGYCATAVTKDR
jgi:hypothetical protein